MSDENEILMQSASAGTDRRGFLLRAGTAGAAVAGVSMVGPGLGSANAAEAQPSRAALSAAAEQVGPMMMYLKDAARGQIALLVGDQEIIYTDPAAVARILSAAGR